MTKRKANFYGVRVGKQPGIYESWEVCKIQVLGFPGSKYKGFQTRSEAEDYVNDILPCSQFLSVSSPIHHQTQAIADVDNKHRHYLPSTTTLNGNITHGSSDTIPSLKKEVTLPSQPSINDPSQHYKLVEENGQQFVVFESLETFDSYFEGLCGSRHSSTHILESLSKSHEIKARNQTADVIQHLQSKVALEDDEFVYFKDENDLKEFLEPYFEDAKQRAVLQTVSYSQNLAVLGQWHGEPQRVAAQERPAEFLLTEGMYQLEFDGASRGNPGHAGAGALIRCPHGSVVLELTEFLGTETNNVAEYRALILGLKGALAKGIRKVKAHGDSKLVCLQVIGAWKVENKKLISLHEEVKTLEVLFEVFSISHIRREYNSEADALANKAANLGEPVHEVVKTQPGCCSNRNL